MEDSKLIRSIKLGRRGALDRAIGQYSGYAAAVARGVLGPQASREDLEEIVADVFVALWRSAARLDETRPLKSYLAAIARNAAVDPAAPPAAGGAASGGRYPARGRRRGAGGRGPPPRAG